MKEEKVNYLIDKHLRGIGSQSEEDALQSWLDNNAQNRAHFDQIARIQQEIKHLPLDINPETDNQWSLLQEAIEQEDRKNPEARIVRMSPMRQLLRIAAMLVLVFGIGWIIQDRFLDQPLEIAQEYHIQKGDIDILTLEDGSKVYLNSDSKLAVYEGFNEKNRRLKLEGEAYFEVSENSKLPFLIQTGSVATEVTGTAFNLRAYPENESVLLNVVEGSVKFQTEKQEVSVVANVAAAFDKKNQRIQRAEFNEDIASALKDGKLAIEDMTLDEGLRAIERRYNIEFSNQSIIVPTSFRLIINKDEPLDAVLEELGDILSVQTEKNDRIIRFFK